jgi:hypothetical protein
MDVTSIEPPGRRSSVYNQSNRRLFDTDFGEQTQANHSSTRKNTVIRQFRKDQRWDLDGHGNGE